MSAQSEKALARAVKPVPVIARPDMFQSLEAAFIAFLESKSRPDIEVPVERRVFLTVSQAVSFTGLPLSYLRKLIAGGTIKAVKAGRTWRIPRAELESLPQKIAQLAVPMQDLSAAQERDLEMNKLRRQGLLPPPI